MRVGERLIAKVFDKIIIQELGADRVHIRRQEDTLLFDVALGVIGPLGGWIVSGGSYSPMFAIAAGMSLAALVLTGVLYMRYGKPVRA